MPYMVNKWVNGFLTNFEEIRKNIKKFQNLNSFVQKETFKQLKKKEQSLIERNLEKLRKTYEGVLNLWKLPDFLFIVGLKKEKNSQIEANKMGIPVIAICNTNADIIGLFSHLIGNDENTKSINFLVGLVSETIIENNDNETNP